MPAPTPTATAPPRRQRTSVTVSDAADFTAAVFDRTGAADVGAIATTANAAANPKLNAYRDVVIEISSSGRSAPSARQRQRYVWVPDGCAGAESRAHSGTAAAESR